MLALRTDNGSLFQEKGWTSLIGDSLLPQCLYVSYQKSQWYRYILVFESKGAFHSAVGGDDTTSGINLNVLKDYDSLQVAFINIFTRSSERLGRDNWDVGIAGMLIAVLRKADGVIYGRVICGAL